MVGPQDKNFLQEKTEAPAARAKNATLGRGFIIVLSCFAAFVFLPWVNNAVFGLSFAWGHLPTRSCHQPKGAHLHLCFARQDPLPDLKLLLQERTFCRVCSSSFVPVGFLSTVRIRVVIGRAIEVGT